MPDCEFSTITVAPHGPAHPDPVNIGVILYDPGTNTAYRRVTDNWDEVRRRTGFVYIPGRDEQAVQGPFRVGDDYLKNLVEGQVRDRLVVSPPRNLMPFETHEAALEWVYSMQVGVPDSGGGAAARLRGEIARAGFPPGCYKRTHEFDLDGPAVRVPNVFFAGSRPRNALFALSFAAPGSHAAARMALGKVRTVRELAGLDVEFSACIVQDEHEVDKGRTDVRGCTGLLDKWGVECVYWDGVGDMLGRIRRAVLPHPSAPGRRRLGGAPARLGRQAPAA